VVPGRIDDNGPKLSGHGLDRQTLVLVLLLPELSIGTVDLAGLVHLGGEGPEALRLILGGLDDSRALLDRAPRDAGESADFVTGLAAITSGNFPGVLIEGGFRALAAVPSPAP
jgi:hypothetical protein